jgi:hypothetical protein
MTSEAAHPLGTHRRAREAASAVERESVDARRTSFGCASRVGRRANDARASERATRTVERFRI